ncbi:MAG TPA: glycosyltransferase [Tahibacter sp.]|uniref:glycosyltransferase n=1 Tax=Tahibacter sp. TaxID=2056211 RepID=UPI002C20DE01|nr:glycosyltransferase [Tahibacter sp.]HSX59232.1 glycosyltransferase [Tahibacter sp.]
MAAAPDVLYVSYNGIAEPLVESQVLAYLRKLAGYGFRFTLLTFERRPPADADALRRRLADEGIRWHWLRSVSGFGPLTSLLDVARGLSRVRQLHRQQGFSLVHARSFLPALIAQRFKRRHGVPYLNDLRGFWIDEKVYRGRLRENGAVYRIAKRLETQVLRDSDYIVSLSERGLRTLDSWGAWRGEPPPSATIPTCVDLDRFVPDAADTTGAAPVFGYVGSLSEEYLPEEIFAWFAAALVAFPAARLHLVTRSEPAPLQAALARHRIPAERVRLLALPPARVPAEIRQFDAALSFIRPHLAKFASCPTKVGEYLACGVPVVSNRDIGDLDTLLADGAAGCLVDDFGDAARARSFEQLAALWRDPQLKTRCRALAERHFSLARGSERYALAYRRILGTAP